MRIYDHTRVVACIEATVFQHIADWEADDEQPNRTYIGHLKEGLNIFRS